MIHCAGISPIAAVADADPETGERTFAVNVASAAELTESCACEPAVLAAVC
ncbi:hypothetical protein [Nonomuraea dietziae]|uniref:hypothetical protein n=1 Tax=Nonomuraea dietziae TaxID=65515 RepID=UPI00343DE19C